MSTATHRACAAAPEPRAGGERRKAPRILLALDGELGLDGDFRLPCTVHDVSEGGIGIFADPKAAKGPDDARLLLRCGDKVALRFALPGAERIVSARARVLRVLCRDGSVNMGLALRGVTPQVLEALARRAAAPARGVAELSAAAGPT